MAERSTLGLAHQLLDLLRENQEQAVPLEHARLLVNLARALVRPQDAPGDMYGDHETEIALDLPGAALDGPLSPALVETAEPELPSNVVDAALASVALVKTPEPRKEGYEMDTLEVAAPAHLSLEHLDAPTRSTYQPSSTVNTENDDSSASSNTTRALDQFSAQDTSLDPPLPPSAVVFSTMPALVQPPKCAVSAELEPNVVPALYSGHQLIPAPGTASSTTVSPRSRDDTAHTKTELTESAALPPAIPFTELSPMTKEEDTPILLLAKYPPPPLPLHNHERASASPPAWVKTEPVDSPGLSSLPIGPGDETNASALPIPKSTYPPPSEGYQTHVKIEPVDSPALFSLPSSIPSVRQPLVSTTEEGDSSIPPSVPLENATAPRVLVKTELIDEDALAAMQVPSAQRNGGLHSPFSTAPSVIYHHTHTPTFQHASAKVEPLDAFMPAIQPSPRDAGSTPIVYSADHLQGSALSLASPSVKAEHKDIDLAHEQEPLSSLASTAGATPPLVKADPVDPSIGISSTDEADTPNLRLAKNPPAPTPTPVKVTAVHVDGDAQSLRTTHGGPSLPSSLVTAAFSHATRDYCIPIPQQSPTTGDLLQEQTALEIASAPPLNATAAFENAAYIPIVQDSPTTPGDSLAGQTVLEILSAPETLKSSSSSGATSDMPIVQPLPRMVHVESEHVESEALASPSAPSIPDDTHDLCDASTALSSNTNTSADVDGVDADRISTRSPSTSTPASSTTSLDAGAASSSALERSNSPATNAGGYANVFMLAAWSDDETSPVNAQQQDLFPPVPPPTPASSSPTPASPTPNVPRSPSPSPAPNVPHSPLPSAAALVLPLQTTTAHDADAPMNIDGGAASGAYEGECTETQEQEQEQEEEHRVPRLLLRMSSPVTAPTQGQRDAAVRTDGSAHDMLGNGGGMFDVGVRFQQENEPPHVASLLRRMSGPGHNNCNNAGATEQQDEDDSLPSTSNIFSRLGDDQSVSGRASLRSRFDIPPSLSLAERISPPTSVRAEHHGHSNFKRRHREDGMEDGGSAVGRSESKRRRRK